MLTSENSILGQIFVKVSYETALNSKNLKTALLTVKAPIQADISRFA